MKRYALLAAIPFLLVSCTTPQPPQKGADKPSSAAAAWRNDMYNRMDGAVDLTSYAGSSIPVLGSPALTAEWGKPSINRAADGSTRLTYKKPGELYGLICFSLTSPVATPDAAPAWEEAFYDPTGSTDKNLYHPQQWRTTTVAGHPVRWCQLDGGGGADFPTYSTECFSHTDAEGRTGYYIVHAWSTGDDKTVQLLKKAAFLGGR